MRPIRNRLARGAAIATLLLVVFLGQANPVLADDPVHGPDITSPDVPVAGPDVMSPDDGGGVLHLPSNGSPDDGGGVLP